MNTEFSSCDVLKECDYQAQILEAISVRVIQFYIKLSVPAASYRVIRLWVRQRVDSGGMFPFPDFTSDISAKWYMRMRNISNCSPSAFWFWV